MCFNHHWSHVHAWMWNCAESSKMVEIKGLRLTKYTNSQKLSFFLNHIWKEQSHPFFLCLDTCILWKLYWTSTNLIWTVWTYLIRYLIRFLYVVGPNCPYVYFAFTLETILERNKIPHLIGSWQVYWIIVSNSTVRSVRLKNCG